MTDTHREAALLEGARHYAEGIIMCMPQGEYPPDPDGPPVVAINRRLRGAHAVLLDQANVIEQQLGHLVGLGHERIVYLDGPKQYWATYERRRHAERLARDFPLEIIGPIQPFFHGGYEVGRPARPGDHRGDRVHRHPGRRRDRAHDRARSPGARPTSA